MSNGFTPKLIPLEEEEAEQPTPAPVGQPSTETGFTPTPIGGTTEHLRPSGKTKVEQTEPFITPANVIRYGIPTAVGLTGVGTGPVVLSAAVSEILARIGEGLEEGKTTSEITSDALKGGLWTGAIDLGVESTTKGLGKLWRLFRGKFPRRWPLPKSLDPDVQTAQDVLTSFSSEPLKQRQYLKKLGKFLGKDLPFSLSTGQLQGTTKSFASFLEGVSRSGLFGRGRHSLYDKRNVDRVYRALEEFVEHTAQFKSGDEFAEILAGTNPKRKGASAIERGIIGPSGFKGVAFDPVAAISDGLYKEYRRLLAAAPQTIDATSMLKYFRRNKDKKHQAEILSGISGMDAFPGIDTKGADEAWKKLPLAAAYDINERMVKFFKAPKSQQDEAFNAVLGEAREKLMRPFNEALDTVPGAKAARDAANLYWGEFKDVFDAKLLRAVRNELADNPSKVLDLVALKENKYGMLTRLKEALQMSGEAVGKIERAGGVPSGMGGAEAVRKYWEESILKPIRYHFLSQSMDGYTKRMSGGKIINKIMDIKKESGGPQFLEEVWGKEGLEQLEKFATTLDVLERKGEQSIFIQLAQATRIMEATQAFGAVAGGYAYASADEPLLQKLGGAAGLAFFIGPYLLSKSFTNPKLMRNLTLGLQEGPKSPRFLRAFRQLVVMHEASKKDFDKQSPQAGEFYNTIRLADAPTPGSVSYDQMRGLL